MDNYSQYDLCIARDVKPHNVHALYPSAEEVFVGDMMGF